MKRQDAKIRNYYVDDIVNRDWLRLLSRIREIMGLEQKQGRFVTQEGRVFMIGGPGSGGGGTSAAGAAAAPSIPALASELAERAAVVEPEITAIVTGVVEEGGGHMEGLDFRLKAQESIESKIKRDAEEEGISPVEAAQGVTDLVRYTAVFEGSDLTENATKLQEELAAKGWTQYDHKFRNYFAPPPPDRAYRGYNTVYQNKKGQTFELQFHTPQSLQIKERVHKLYEEARELPKGPKRTALYQQMGGLWSEFESPANWQDLAGVVMQ